MCLFVHVKTVLKENVVFSLKWWRPDVNETWRGIFCFINIVYFFYRFTIERVTPNGKHQLLKSFSKSTKKDDNTTYCLFRRTRKQTAMSCNARLNSMKRSFVSLSLKMTTFDPSHSGCIVTENNILVFLFFIYSFLLHQSSSILLLLSNRSSECILRLKE